MPRTKKAQPQTKAVKKESNAAIIADAKPTEDSSAAALTAAQPSTVVEKKDPAKTRRRKKNAASASVSSAEPETAAAEDQAKIPGPAEKKLTERPEVKTTETVKEAPVVPDTFMNPPENAADTTSETSSPAPISETEKKPAKRGRKKKSESPEVSKAVKPVKKEKTTRRKAALQKAGAVDTKPEITSAVTVQFSGKSYSTEDLIRIAKDVWKYDMERNEADLRTVEFFVKPEENKVYFVVNGDVTGDFAI